MSIIDRVKSHFEGIGIQSMEVPEWKDDDGKPLLFYWNPINIYLKKIDFLKNQTTLNDVSNIS